MKTKGKKLGDNLKSAENFLYFRNMVSYQFQMENIVMSLIYVNGSIFNGDEVPCIGVQNLSLRHWNVE